MGRDDSLVSQWARNSVYIFRQGGPVLISIMCMGAVAWQAMTQVTKAVEALTISVERNAAVTTRFMEGVASEHKAQIDALKSIQSAVRQKQSSGLRSTDPSNIGGIQ